MTGTPELAVAPGKPTWLKRWSPPLAGLALGLVAGPMLSIWLGWQVSASDNAREVHAAKITEKVEFCAERARAANPKIWRHTFVERREIAEPYSKMPWNEDDQERVLNSCASTLGGKPDTSS